MSTSSASNSLFTGGSTYTQDFQNLISRATAIASLPITQLNSDKAALSDQSTALSSLDTKFQAIQSAIQDIANALNGSSFDASISDDQKLGVTLSEGAVEGSYLVDVVDPGTYATSMTPNNWVAGTGAVRKYWLSLDGVNYALSPANNSAAAVAAAINEDFGNRVRATVVNVGGSTADYRVSLQCVQLGDLKPGLVTGPLAPASMQTQEVAGSNTLAASVTRAPWDDDASQTLELSLGGRTYALNPADNTAEKVAEAINTDFGTQVSATAVNEGTAEAPVWRITLTAKNPGNAAPDILATPGGGGDPVSLQDQTATGSDTKAKSATTSAWVTDTGAPLTWQLSLGGVKYTVTPKSNSIADVVSAINSQHGDKVRAVTVDNGASDLRISLTAVNPGDLQPDLIASQVNLSQQQDPPGALAQYIVNNSGKTVTSTSRSVTIATGLTVNLLAKDNGAPVSVNISRPTAALGDAFQRLVDAYNAAVDELDKQHGDPKAALAGQSILRTLSHSLTGMATYTDPNGGVNNLAELGFELDKTGHVSFNASKLMVADLTRASAVTAFLGSTDSGFLKMATDAVKSIEDPFSGVMLNAKNGVTSQIATVQASIDDAQERIDRMTIQMQEQMAASDALIAAMQQQYTYMANMFSAMQTQSEGYR